MKFRTFQTICQYIVMALLIALFGIVGGVEQGTLTVLGGVLLAIVDLALTVFFAYCGGMIYGQK